jgi:hypothetical protein
MFHRPVSITGHRNGGLSQQPQNENLIHRGNNNQNQLNKPTGTNNNNVSLKSINGGSISKTPATKKSSNRRRALGDISNKKGNGFSVVVQEKSKPQQQQQQQNEVLKPRSTNLLPTGNNSTTKKKLSNRNVNSLLPERHITSLVPRPSTHKTHLAVLSEHDPSSISTNQIKRQTFMREETVPDIELPAGRTWKEQLKNELKDEDDMASISSIDSILNMKGCSSPLSMMWDGMGDALLKREKEEAEKEDKQIQEQIQVMMEREREETEKSLDNLYNIFDNLDILNDSDGDGDRNDSILQEDWSIPGSSVCDANADDDLLFPL